MKFYQSETELIRRHYVIGKKEELLDEMNVRYTTWIEK